MNYDMLQGFNFVVFTIATLIMFYLAFKGIRCPYFYISASRMNLPWLFYAAHVSVFYFFVHVMQAEGTHDWSILLRTHLGITLLTYNIICLMRRRSNGRNYR